MPLLTLATRLLVELARELASRSSHRNSRSQPAKAPGALSDLPNEGTTTPEPNLGTLLYLISLGVVATATVVVFLGLGFFLLAHSNEEPIAGTSDRGVEVEPQHADLVSPPNKDAAPFPTQTAPAPSVPPVPSPETHEVLPPASKHAALGSAIAADTGAANSTFGVSAGPGLQGDQATPPTPAGVYHAKKTRIGQHRHAGARKHWAGISRPGPNYRPLPAIGAPELAWRWIVQSATGVLASLSPPPSQPPPGFRTR